MWLCTQHGFFSIVQKQPDEYHVRARVRGDLDNLRVLCGQAKQWKIHRSEDADYRYRIVVAAADVAIIMARLGESIDYHNFKGRIHQLPDQAEKGPAYGQLWAALVRLQR